jgi:hypothetical protein
MNLLMAYTWIRSKKKGTSGWRVWHKTYQENGGLVFCGHTLSLTTEIQRQKNPPKTGVICSRCNVL